MSKRGPIILIENDLDDQFLFEKAFREVGVMNKLIFFRDGNEVFNYLMSTQEHPFVIICDMSLEGKGGIELKKEVNATDHLRMKSIPFIFLTNSSNPDNINEAYFQMVQGYFVKPDEFESLKVMLKLIVDYWLACKYPNNQGDA